MNNDISRGPRSHQTRFHAVLAGHECRLAGVTAAIVTIAAFAKLFVPFYLVGSTAIFAIASLMGLALIALNGRPVYNMATTIPCVLWATAAFYGLVIINFLLYSRPLVPMTHLYGILIFHSLFMIFGFAASRALKALFMLLIGAAVFYAVVVVRYTVQFGDIMQGGMLNDIFGVGIPGLYIAFHQKIGLMLGPAGLAVIGLSNTRTKRIVAGGVMLIIIPFMYYIAARAALVALIGSMIFLGSAALWVRSKKLALLGGIVAVAATMVATGLLYKFALQYNVSHPTAADAMSRTVREIQHPSPGLRVDIWSQVWHQIATEPERLWFGRGIGIYPVTEGYGPPDWYLHPTIASQVYPHNVHLELLYEAGIPGLLLFSVFILLPLAVSLKYWHLLSSLQRAAISMYVFHLIGSEFSGSFGFGYLDLFFLATTAGIIAQMRIVEDLIPFAPAPEMAAGEAPQARQE